MISEPRDPIRAVLFAVHQVESAQPERDVFDAITRTKHGVALHAVNGRLMEVELTITAAQLLSDLKLDDAELAGLTTEEIPVPVEPSPHEQWAELLYWMATLESALSDFGHELWYHSVSRRDLLARITLSDGNELGTYVARLDPPDVVPDVATDAAIAFVQRSASVEFQPVTGAGPVDK